MARVGFDLGASALQCITLTPKIYITEDFLTMNNPNPNPNPYFVYKSLICQREFGGWK